MASEARRTFERETFEATRASEYFVLQDPAALTGQPPERFANVLMKELADNALDAAETRGVPPRLALEVNVDGELLTIAVTDNGPGIPSETVAKVLEFSTKTSDKAAYRSPTRGAQGNALKTVLGIPAALGGADPLVIEARGVHHRIRAWLDPAGDVRVQHDREPSERPGTCFTVTVPSKEQNFERCEWRGRYRCSIRMLL